MLSVEVDSILHNAAVLDKSDEQEAQETKERDTESRSVSISVDEGTTLFARKLEPLQPPNCLIVPLKVNSKHNASPRRGVCRFTVIGRKTGGSNSRPEVWRFVSVTQLMKGLQGVHRSVSALMWLDVVCDGETFARIAEHIRPRIHSLTDVCAVDCREKNYLFLSISAPLR